MTLDNNENNREDKLLAVERSLTTKQVTQVTLVTLATICIFIIIQFSYFIEERRNEYLYQLNSIAQSIEQPISQNVWHMNYGNIQNVLNGLSSMNILTAADVIIPSQYRALHGDFPAHPPVPEWFAKIFRLPVTTIIPLYAPNYKSDNQLPIAQLVLRADPYLMYQFILHAGITFLLTFVSLSLMLAVAISVIMNRLLISPLKSLAMTLSTLPQGMTHQLALPPQHEDDELGMLVRNYNRNQVALNNAYQDLRRLSTRDPLTDLPNRALFDELLNQYLINSAEEETEFSLLYIGISSIKETASALGLEVTDQLLSVIGNRLKQIIDNPNILARLGGEEFIVLVPGKDKVLQAMLLAQQIVEHVSEPIELNQLTQYLSANIGIAHFPNDGYDALQLVRNARSALVSAEKQGKNTILFFEPYLTESIQHRLFLENEIVRGIEKGEFVLYLQPQVDMRDNKLIGAEALVRWHHSSNEVRPPNDFIPLAEETGLIIALGEQILEQACQYLADWQRKGIKTPISVNLAAAQIAHVDFPRKIKQLVTCYQIDPKLLKLEVTETGRIENMESAIALLQHLHQVGFSIVLDDFGIGYSNLNYLRLLDIDTIKIDKSFIQNNLPHDKALVKIVGKIAEVFNVSVIAEGVETSVQKEQLLANHIFLAQGYLYNPPLPKDLFEKHYF